MEEVIPRLDKLEQRKQLAVQSEDFEAAKQLKSEIDRIRATSLSLKELNKIALQSLVVNIPKIANDISASKLGSSAGGGGVSPFFPSRGNNINNNPAAVALPTPQVREIYNAEDFHSQKREEIETKLREKEAEMRSYFEVPRPQEIDFSDVPRDSQTKTKPTAKKNRGGGGGEEDDDNDSPLADNSDDMEKIIAERIAARQRDLDEISERMKARMPPHPPGHVNSLVPLPPPREYSTSELDVPTPLPLPAPLSMDPSPNNQRKVRFQEDTDDNPILLKLKRKPTVE
jgi:hypothetical protein